MNGVTVGTLKAGSAYFALVFGAGFMLGAIRVPLLVPRLGERMAELLEMPLTCIVIWWSARFVIRRYALPAALLPRLGAGLLALLLLVGAELLLTVALQERSVGEYLESRDPISGSVYLAMLVLFTAMPSLLAWGGTMTQPDPPP